MVKFFRDSSCLKSKVRFRSITDSLANNSIYFLLGSAFGQKRTFKEFPFGLETSIYFNNLV